jgi:multicomponent K+:H+ antiporter subunit D
MTSSAHLVVLPIVLPLIAGAAMLMLDERRLAVKAAIGVVSACALLAAALMLVRLVDTAGTQVYRLGAWPSPFGIALVADRLSALMVALAGVLGLTATVFAIARWQREGPRVHALIQFLLMGVNGALLTGDLFNLFVFFEVLLAASYGLALHGSGAARVRAGLHYITINLVASLLFLIGASLAYAATGTLNLADIAARVATLDDGERVLLETGAALLGIAFLIKAGMWPLCFWLPGAYAAASAPAAALFAMLTKVGVLVVLRIVLLVFGDEAGASAGFGLPWLVAGGLATLAFGAIGVIASQDLAHLASYSVLVSSGTLLAAAGWNDSAMTTAALYYLLASTLGVSALYLLTELVDRGRTAGAGAGVLAVTAEMFEAEVERDAPGEDDPVGVAIPATMALLGTSYACCALVLAGLPPLAGFTAKFALLDALFGLSRDHGPITTTSWIMLALLLLSGLCALIGLGRAGVRRFWAAPPDWKVPRVRVIEMAPVAALLALAIALTVGADPVLRYLGDAARVLHAPHDGYVERVLPSP